jgi:hypothetical protein
LTLAAISNGGATFPSFSSCGLTKAKTEMSSTEHIRRIREIVVLFIERFLVLVFIIRGREGIVNKKKPDRSFIDKLWKPI